MNALAKIGWAITVLSMVAALFLAPLAVLGVAGVYLLLCWLLEKPLDKP